MWEDCLKRFVFDSRCDKIRADIVERNRNRNRRDKRTKSDQLQQQHRQQQGGELPQSADALIQTVATLGVLTIAIPLNHQTSWQPTMLHF